MSVCVQMLYILKFRGTGFQMDTASGKRNGRIDLRTNDEERNLIVRAAEVAGVSMSTWMRANLRDAALMTLADRSSFALPEEKIKEWDAINERPARELSGLRKLMERPSPLSAR